MDPILQYLIEFNQENSIEYNGRYLVPPGGLEEMLKNFQGFRLNREEIVKPLIEDPEPDPSEATVDELYKLLED